MKKKYFILLLATHAAGLSLPVAAAGLGDINVCPPDYRAVVAQIPIFDVAALSESEISARLASDSEVNITGIRHTAEVRALSFLTDFSVPDSPVVRVSGCQRSGEYELQFVMDFRWPKGRLLREYTIEIGGGADQDGQEPVPRMSVYTALPAGNGKLPPGSRYKVNSGDTIWGIASRLSSDKPVSHRIDAIVQLNPGAFINNDLSLLRADVVLFLP